MTINFPRSLNSGHSDSDFIEPFYNNEGEFTQSCRCRLFFRFSNYEKVPLKFQGHWFCLKKQSLMLMGRVILCFYKKKKLSYNRKLQATNVNWTLDNH